MKVLQISAECYPAAKSGGLGDVVGSLPKYLNQAGVETSVVIPKYGLKWMENIEWKIVHKGVIKMHQQYTNFTIELAQNIELGFPLYVANILGRFDRPGIYSDPGGHYYQDGVERWLSFQLSILNWLTNDQSVIPDVLHCHDHHTGLIPFFINHVTAYRKLSEIPTVYTIHNGQYHGAYSWEKLYLLPHFAEEHRGLLDWSGLINPLATGVKTAWRVTTVSEGYMEELRHQSVGLEPLFGHEQFKCKGIINGIDNQVWDPATDPRITTHLKGTAIAKFKTENKKEIARQFNIDVKKPLFTFIGRLVYEKGADLIPDLVKRVQQSGLKANFFVLGTGEPYLHEMFKKMSKEMFNFFDTSLEYNETLAHQLYAGSDFLLMPSRVEPCGLNQMYSCRYGTIPVVRAVGGLKDTIPDIIESPKTGKGFRFYEFDLDEAFMAVYKAIELHKNKKQLTDIRKRIMGTDFSWQNSVKQYKKMYQELISVGQKN